jgi:hypothetical protein
MSHKFLLAAAGSAALLGLSACDQIDPLVRDGLWHPMHVNRTDLTMTVANPADLVRGTGSRTTDGTLAAAAVQRLHDNKVKKLPQSGTSDIVATSQGSSQE